MATSDFTSNRLPIFKVKLTDSKIVGFKKPHKIILSKDAYAINYYGSAFWTGEFQEGDIVIADPQAIPSHGDYVVIFIKGQKEPVVEQMALSYLPDTIGKTLHPESNAIPTLSISRPNDVLKFVPCHKLEKVHKIIGKAYEHKEVAHY